MNYKTLIVGTFLSLGSSAAFAQSCSDSAVELVVSGTQNDTLIRMVDRSCGSNGWVCLDLIGDLDQSTSNRVYAAALTAQATGSDADVSWDPSTRGCGAAGIFPVITNFQVQ